MAKIRYTLAMPDPRTHLFHVSIDVRGLGAETIDFVMPAWSPGSYKIRDYARNVQDARATGPVRKVDKHTWRVAARGRDARLDYRVYAFELNVRGLHLDADHGYFNGAAVFMYVDGLKESPVTLEIRPAPGWRVVTGLGLAGTVFEAPSYDVLADSPVECGRFELLTWRTLGRIHRFAIHGRGNHDAAKLRRDVAKIVEAEARMFGGLPYEHYTFLLHLTATEGGGGLEHLNSTSLQAHPLTFRPRKRYERFLELVAHEFFHLWNVKRIRPSALGPFDYTREVHTTLLWAMEGVTSYYDWLVPCRAGLVTPKRYLEELAERLQTFLEKPGRRHQSLSESSFDAWIKFYNPNEQSPNAQVSYYEKGALVALALDFEIRRRTANRRSLDDVLRLLWQEYGRRGAGFPEPEYRRAVERVAGGGFGAFWSAHIDGTAELDWDRAFAVAGLRLARERRKEEGRPGPAVKPWLGIVAGRAGDRVLVHSVRSDSPAEKAALSARDEILAIDGCRVDADTWQARLEDRAPGDRIAIDYFRDARRRRTTAVLAAKENVALKLQPVEKPSAMQRAVYESWLGARWGAGRT
jgi:predicted metalloprotease with PDZ domain